MARYDSSLNPLKVLEDIPEAHFTALSEAIRCMLLVPWWDRIWVVQEAVVAETLTVRYGNVAVSWKLLVEVARVLSRWEFVHGRYPSSISAADLKVFNLFSRVIDLDRFRKSWRESQGANLLSLLRYFGQRKASDDRDRVYGLLGLCNEATEIRPDYELDVGSVYMAPVIETINSTKSLSVLYGDHSRKGRQDLPSWVLDWNAALDENERQRTALPNLYDACRGVIPMLVTGQDNLGHFIKKEMSLLLRSLMAELDPKNLLREELALKLRNLNIRSSMPVMLEIKPICKDLTHYCHKDGRKGLPRLSLIKSSEKSLKIRGRRIGVVSEITNPLYTSSDINTAAKILDGWWTEAHKRIGDYTQENFLRTIMSDAMKTPDGLLARLQTEDMTILKKWFHEKTMQRSSESRHHVMISVDAESDRTAEVLRLSATKRTLFFINEYDSFYDQWRFYSQLQESLDDQHILLEKSRKLLDQDVEISAHLELLYEHKQLLWKTRLLERGFITRYIKEINQADSFRLSQLFDKCNRLLDGRERQFDSNRHIFYDIERLRFLHSINKQWERTEQDLIQKEMFIHAQTCLINEHLSYIDQEREVLHKNPNIWPYDSAYFEKDGHMVLGPMLTKEGDEIYILPGSTVPLVLRPIDYHGPRPHCHYIPKYQLLGDCFIHGVMDGELGTIGGCILDYIVHLDSHFAKFPNSLDENVDATSIEEAVNLSTDSDLQMESNIRGEIGEIVEIEIE